MKKITKNNTKKIQTKLLKGLSKETVEFIEKSNKFLKENNIKPKEYGYQSGLSFRPYADKR